MYVGLVPFQSSPLCRESDYGMWIRTFRQYFPLGRFGAPLLRHQVPQLFEQFLHLCPALPLRELVADAQLGGPAVWLSAGVRIGLLSLEVTKLFVLQGMMVNGRELARVARHALIIGSCETFVQPSLSRWQPGLGGPLAASKRFGHAAPPRIDE